MELKGLGNRCSGPAELRGQKELQDSTSPQGHDSGHTPHERFWSKVAIAGPEKCWPWTGARTGSGYGSFGFAGRVVTASRHAYVLTHGEPAAGLDVMHSCDNPPCCNPAHLEAGTRSRNMLDCSQRGRMAPHKSKLTPAELDRICEEYLSGAHGRVIAKKFGVHWTYPSWLVRKRGLRRQRTFDGVTA